MKSVTLDDEQGRTLTLSREEDDGRQDATFLARLTIPEGTVETSVYDHRDGLTPYFTDLAAKWRGWKGVKNYGSLEGQLEMTARHDGLGTVSINVVLGQLWPPEWTFEAVLAFGSGAHLERIARDVADFWQS